MKASAIRELLKLTQRPEVISFAGGLPAPELFPIEDVVEVTKEMLEEEGQVALQYGATEGYEPLRRQIVERMNKVGVETSFENILVLSGSQQGLEFAAKLLINPGDIILCESPTYLGALNAFNAYEPDYLEVPTDDDGMVLEDLEEMLKNNENAKFIYVIPDFQNPSGNTWTVERRKGLVELANKYDVVILEDNPYGELRFEGEMPPAVKHYDTEGRVIFLGTFSKIFSPGLRVAWACAEGELFEKLVLAKQGADLQSSTFTQMLVSKFLEKCDIEEHISKIKKVYSKRRDVMLDTMEREFPEGVKFTHPEGGLFTWVILPEHIDSNDLATKALENNVAFVPGSSFFPHGGNANTMRLNYSSMTEEKIEEGIKRLATAIKSMM
jgi:2-aminoadipate transaminase